MRYGMVIDLNRCTGCHGCAMACKAQHGIPAGVWWSKVLETEEGTYPNCHVLYTPVLCMHCENAPCVEVCPTGATFKREDGIVMQNEEACIGCQLCVNACGYGARTFVEKIEPVDPDHGFNPYEEMMYQQHYEGVVQKCNFCADQLDEGEDPACVRTCVAYARYFGDLDDPESDVSKVLAEHTQDAFQPEPGNGSPASDYKPSVYYLPKVNLI